jgi:hypothetical protein
MPGRSRLRAARHFLCTAIYKASFAAHSGSVLFVAAESFHIRHDARTQASRPRPQLIELRSLPARAELQDIELQGSADAGGRPALHIRHDERADRAMIAAAPEAYMAVVVLTRLHLLTVEQVAGRDLKPARARLHQLIAGDREAIHVAAAG